MIAAAGSFRITGETKQYPRVAPVWMYWLPFCPSPSARPQRGHRVGEIRLLHERIRPQGRHQLLLSDKLPGPFEELD